MTETEMRFDPLRETWTVFCAERLAPPPPHREGDTRQSPFAAGASVQHSISQLIATSVVPAALKQKLRVARDFYERKRRSIFQDILGEEIRVAKRLVYENNGFAVFCPYASRAPFEMAIYPKRQVADLHGISDQENSQLADALKISLQKLNAALDSPAYNLA